MAIQNHYQRLKTIRERRDKTAWRRFKREEHFVHVRPTVRCGTVFPGALLIEEPGRPEKFIAKKQSDSDNGRSASVVRILVVDDFERFRQFVCSTLAQHPNLRVVGEAADGLEAVRKAGEHQPDLVVLDIGLPNLSGIEAAIRIRKLCPLAKILFASQESSADIVRQALSSGGLGYVVKAHAASELLPAVEAVLRGERFVSSAVMMDGTQP